MSQRVGSARSSFGCTKPGDQSGGKEVSTQAWYKHSKGWYALVCTVPGANEYIAEAMEKACANNDIGYDQATRGTLRENVKNCGFDPSKTSKKVNTDCSALVRVCIEYALRKVGNSTTIPNFTTGDQRQKLLATGVFRALEGSKYENSGAYLPRGTVLVTKVKGHTVVVLDRGGKCDTDTASACVRIMKSGCVGSDVAALQEMLIKLGYSCGRWGVDGDFGDSTRLAVLKFQADHCLVQDGEVGDKTMTLLRTLITSAPSTGNVRIYGGKCYVREEPNTCGLILCTCGEGSEWEYAGETSSEGWLKIKVSGSQTGWVSGKYGRRV